MDHAAHNYLGKIHHGRHRGREIASVVELSDLDGEQPVDLRDSYNHGGSVWA